jgi:tetratricopeptide (TPR) repeat protein
MPSIKTEVIKFFRDIGAGFGAIIGLFLTTTRLVDFFGIDFPWVQKLGIYGPYIVGIHALLIALVYSIVMFVRRWVIYEKQKISIEQSEPKSARKLSFELAKIVEENHKAKNYVEVVRFGSQLSRPLWLSGMYLDRIRIGEMIGDAAPRVNMYKEQIVAFIDDIGWTNAVLGNLEKAERNIYYGIRLANERGMFYFAAKGERHLAGICQRYRNDINKGITHFERAMEFADKIQDNVDKLEMKAGILFGQADMYITSGQYNQALSAALESKNIYKTLGDQEERLVKSHSQLGRISLGLKDMQKAKDIFLAGLEEARRLHRRDEIASNLVGAGEVYFENEAYVRATEALSEAQEIYEELGMKYEEHRTRELKVKAEAAKAVSRFKESK